jgi:hypothetical protein
MRKSKTLKNKTLTIDGTYGDKVRLVLDGYISTKYGDFYKIVEVDVDKRTVKTYGGGDFDFSRISSSCTKKQGDSCYIESLERFFKNNKIKVGNVVELPSFKYSLEIIKINLPNLETDYLPSIDFMLDNAQQTLFIDDFDYVSRNIKVIHEVSSIEEKLEEHLSKHLNYADSLINKDEYLKQLIDIFKFEKKII